MNDTIILKNESPIKEVMSTKLTYNNDSVK
jgi:hypothetical protein